MTHIAVRKNNSVVCNLCGADEYTVVADDTKVIQSPDSSYIFKIRLVCCKKCGFVYWNPPKSSSELNNYYKNVYRAPVVILNPDERRREMIRSRFQLLSKYATGKSLLEIGSAEGYFLQKAAEEYDKVVGVEPSEEYAEISRKVVPKADIYGVIFEDFKSTSKYDVICSFFVLEHILDASAHLKQCHDMLSSAGFLYIEVPDVELYPYQYSNMIWHEHVSHFTHSTIRDILVKTGFELVDIVSPCSSYKFGMSVIARKQARQMGHLCKDSRLNHEAHNLAVRCFEMHHKKVASYLSALSRSMDRVLKRVRSAGIKLAIYGTGVYFDSIWRFTSIRKEDVAVVVDDNKEKWGLLTSHGIRVEPPKSLFTSGVGLVLIASDCYEDKMNDNLVCWSNKQPNKFEITKLHSTTLQYLNQ